MQELVSTKDDDTRVTLIDKAAEYPNLSDEGEEMKMPKRIRRFRRQSEEKFPYKEALLAACLTLGGIIFLPIGLYELLGRHDLQRATPFLIICPFVLLPGVYHLVIIIRAYLGHRGYHYHQVKRRPN
eukprot:CAMPEP_0170169530 /NCGR_PEP_ID=MMETSP0040_2-20121228/2445_1 /TAXON_ID=641309 /ORGANISM="Lotharella oceanica, Strain CCMP622" /LENGTH=126 /DNA_ID=CAMNT_0010408327 /DNA_START=57 /DNA_END=437 /DNA_ORIENTATION=-